MLFHSQVARGKETHNSLCNYSTLLSVCLGLHTQSRKLQGSCQVTEGLERGREGGGSNLSNILSREKESARSTAFQRERERGKKRGQRSLQQAEQVSVAWLALHKHTHTTHTHAHTPGGRRWRLGEWRPVRGCGRPSLACCWCCYSSPHSEKRERQIEGGERDMRGERDDELNSVCFVR